MLSLREAARLGRQANLKGSYLTAFHFHLSGESERWESCTGDEGATLRYCWRGGPIFIPSLSLLVPLAYPSGTLLQALFCPSALSGRPQHSPVPGHHPA